MHVSSMKTEDHSLLAVSLPTDLFIYNKVYEIE